MKNLNVKFLLFYLLFTLACCSIPAQSLDRKIDSLVTAHWKDQNGPGGVFLVAHNGVPVYEKAFGKANIELDVNLTPEYVFQIGSMTKQFTAVAILLLAEQGKLNLTDTVSRFIPDYPAGNTITLHHLLTHTSGIRDFTRMKGLQEIAQKEMTPEMIVDFFKNEPSEFAPGEKFEYNNSGYVLLGYIIELVSGKTYEEFVTENIFRKADMQQSLYASDRKIISKRADGYQKKETGYVNKTIISYSIPFSSGALMSTARDMLKWQNALNRNILFKTDILQKAFSHWHTNNGTQLTYGYGWHIRDIDGIITREHGGSIFGFKTMGVYIPEEDIYVIGFSNCDCNSPTQLTRDIATAALQAFRGRKK